MKHLLASNTLLTPLLLLIILLFKINHTTLTRAEEGGAVILQYCPVTSAFYTSGSQYEKNLVDNLLPSLVANGSRTGFLTASPGADPDIVYGLAQCRGDVSMNDCYTCLNHSSVDIIKSCQNRNAATIRRDYCLLRYANFSFFSTYDRYKVSISNPDKAANPVLFHKQLGTLMKNLTSRAISKPSKFETGSIVYDNLNNIYGLVQCTLDLSSTDCSACFQDMLNEIPTCCNGKRGGQVIGPSCYVRFEVYEFFGLKSLPSPPPPTPSPPPPPPPSPSPSPPPRSPSPSPQLPTSPIEMSPQSNAGTRVNDGIRKSISSSSATSPNVAIVVGIIVLAALFLLFVALSCVYLAKRKTKTREETTDQAASIAGNKFILKLIPQFLSKTRTAYKPLNSCVAGENIKSEDSLQFDLVTLVNATNNFSDTNKLGEGGFAVVYKGDLRDGEEIAVKRLTNNSVQGPQQFKNEVALLHKLQHRNLVRLLGYCLEGQETILIYEYVPNRSLDKYLFDPLKRVYLDWGKRYKIIRGIARGLLYLHEDSRLKIIHRDLKAGNILLDGEMNAKIADFGTAKLFGVDQTTGNTNRIAGTLGYMAPEYALHGLFSVKSDVFSFGILLLEIVSGQKINSLHQSTPPTDLVSYAWKHWNEGTSTELIDPALKDNYSRNEVTRSIHVGLLCVQEDIEDRPTMSSVVNMLDNSFALASPAQPTFFSSQSN